MLPAMAMCWQAMQNWVIHSRPKMWYLRAFRSWASRRAPLGTCGFCLKTTSVQLWIEPGHDIASPARSSSRQFPCSIRPLSAYGVAKVIAQNVAHVEIRSTEWLLKRKRCHEGLKWLMLQCFTHVKKSFSNFYRIPHHLITNRVVSFVKDTNPELCKTKFFELLINSKIFRFN